MHIDWKYWVTVVQFDRVEILAAFWFGFQCIAVNWPHPDVPWDKDAWKRFGFGVMQSIAMNRSPQLATSQYSQTQKDSQTGHVVAETKASAETPLTTALPAATIPAVKP
jgi:hypothetical protein